MTDSERVWKAIDQRKTYRTFSNHVERCNVCRLYKGPIKRGEWVDTRSLCQRGRELLDAAVDPVPGRDVNQLKVIR